MDVGIVGAPGSGRTTVFRALLAQRAPRESGGRHAAGTVGAIRVSDPRLDRLSEIFHPRKTTPIEIRVHDLCPSLEPSWPRAEIEAMKRMDLLLLVLPAFADASVEASEKELARLVGELCLEDLALVEKRLAVASRDKLPELTRGALEAARESLDAERPLFAAGLGDPQREALRGYALLTDRPCIAVRNVGEELAGEAVPDRLGARGEALGIPVLQLAGSLEAEMAELPAEERAAFLSEYGVRESAGAAVTRAVIDRNDLIPFFTVSEDECRAWPVRRGTRAREAAGRVHSDIERGFIRAEVIAYHEFEPLEGGMTEARKRGLLHVEGKDYTVRDGDIVHFRFNV